MNRMKRVYANSFLNTTSRQYQNITDFYERLYLYQSYCWYAFIRQDFRCIIVTAASGLTCLTKRP